MDEDVSESGNTAPIDLRMLDLQTVADPLSRLAENLQIAQDGVLYQLGTKEDLSAAFTVPLYTASAIQNGGDRGRPPSQRNRLSQHTVLDEWMESFLFGNVDRPS